jgi:hypothetical protein
MLGNAQVALGADSPKRKKKVIPGLKWTAFAVQNEIRSKY